MIPIELKQNLPFTVITICYQDRKIDIPLVLIDTGSGRTMLAADIAAKIGIFPLENDIPYTVRGVGGIEVVFLRCVDYLKIGEHSLTNFEIEIGGMDYGFEINGIIGMDFLVNAKAIINMKKMCIEFEKS